jgi:hypothetical protein
MADESVKVVVRCRPMNSKETAEGRKDVVAVAVPENRVTITNPDPNAISQDPKSFTFDAVYDDMSTQRAVYDETAYPLVESVLSGYNGTIFAYGQTGCGKTHTMQGRADPPDLRGIIPNSFDHIFDAIKLARDKEFLVRCSYLEIYNEEIRDLLGADHTAKLELHEDPDRGVFVKDLTQVVVDSGPSIDKVMQDGNKHRTTGATLMNDTSSRSHSIFTIIIEMSRVDAADGKEHITRGKLNLVDLAGSERPSKTGATGTRMKEGIKINLSLTALGNVISALVEGASKARHIPYRDSKLTRLLQDSLGGNTKTVMVAAIGPADYNFDETLSTLRYANRAKNIKNKPVVNEDPKDTLLRQYKEEIDRLKLLLVQHLSAAGLDSDALNAILAQANAMGAAMAGGGGGGGGGGGALKAAPKALAAAVASASAAGTAAGSSSSTGAGKSVGGTSSATATPRRSGTGADSTPTATPTAAAGAAAAAATAAAAASASSSSSSSSSQSDAGTQLDSVAGTTSRASVGAAPGSAGEATGVDDDGSGSGSGSGAAATPAGASSSPDASSPASPLRAAGSPRASALSPTQSFRAGPGAAPSSSSAGGAGTSTLGAEAQEAIEAARRDAERERREREELARKLFALQQMVVGKSGADKRGGGGGAGGAAGGAGSLARQGSSGALVAGGFDGDDMDPEMAQARARDEKRRSQNTAAKAKKLASPSGPSNVSLTGGAFDDGDGDADDADDGGALGSGGDAGGLAGGAGGSAAGGGGGDRAKLTRAEKERIVKKVKAKYSGRVDALKREILDLQDEHAQQRESLMATVREQAKEAKLLEALVSLFLSPREVSKVWERAVWNEETEEWTLPRVKPREGVAMRAKAAKNARQPAPSLRGGNRGAPPGGAKGSGGGGGGGNPARSNTNGSVGSGNDSDDAGTQLNGGGSMLASDPGGSDAGSIVTLSAATRGGGGGGVRYGSYGGGGGDGGGDAGFYADDDDEEEEGGAVVSDAEVDSGSKGRGTSMPRLKQAGGGLATSGGGGGRRALNPPGSDDDSLPALGGGRASGLQPGSTGSTPQRSGGGGGGGGGELLMLPNLMGPGGGRLGISLSLNLPGMPGGTTLQLPSLRGFGGGMLGAGGPLGGGGGGAGGALPLLGGGGGFMSIGGENIQLPLLRGPGLASMMPGGGGGGGGSSSSAGLPPIGGGGLLSGGQLPTIGGQGGATYQGPPSRGSDGGSKRGAGLLPSAGKSSAAPAPSGGSSSSSSLPKLGGGGGGGGGGGAGKKGGGFGGLPAI